MCRLFHGTILELNRPTYNALVVRRIGVPPDPRSGDRTSDIPGIQRIVQSAESSSWHSFASSEIGSVSTSVLERQMGECSQRSSSMTRDRNPNYFFFVSLVAGFGFTLEVAGRLDARTIAPFCCPRPCSIVRMGDFKLHEYFEDGSLELYNLREDVREQNSLVTTRPDKADELHAILQQWRKEIGASEPTDRNPKVDEMAEAAAIARLRKPWGTTNH